MLEGWIFEIKADRLLIGERIKMGLFRPCVRTIPCSTISGSLREASGLSKIYATGFLVNDPSRPGANHVERTIIAPRDSANDAVRAPVTVEFLSDVVAWVLVLRTGEMATHDRLTDALPKGRFVMGGMRSKGFGDCTISLVREINAEDVEIREGCLRTRVYEDWCGRFDIRPIRERYGYLHRPDPVDPYGRNGAYHRALFERSLVAAPRLLCDPEGEV